MNKPIYTLGISAYYHDSAAALLNDGAIVAAAQEERFTRKKHDPGFPSNAIRFCLDYAGIGLEEIDYIAFYDKPFLKFERLLETYYAFAPRGVRSFNAAIPVWIKEKINLKKTIRTELEKLQRGLVTAELSFTEHHLSHAASAFYPSPFTEAAILTVDGVGEYATTTIGKGCGKEIEILSEIHFPHSLGLLYSAFTYHTGFKVNSGEYKLMGLAPYGEPKYVDLIFDEIIDVKADGSFHLNMKYFDYATGLKMTNSKFDKLFGSKPRSPESQITSREMDMAASIQVVTEEVMMKLANTAREQSGCDKLVMAGGVALNCVANGRIFREESFKDIWIQPAAGDAGGALGAAFAGWHILHGAEREVNSDGSDRMKGAYLGPEFDDDVIERKLAALGAIGKRFENEDELLKETAKLLVEDKVAGWFQGRMEFGPRALGARSILGDARNIHMQQNMNLKIKHRESFRPFAPSVIVEDVGKYFNLESPSPYMLLVDYVRTDCRKEMTDREKSYSGIEKLNVPRSNIPAVTHIDYSARIQTVDKRTAPRYWKLLNEFKNLTGHGLVINTSFNVRGEPIVCTPEDAYLCFMRTEMDFLVCGNWLLLKEDQPALEEKQDWRKLYQPD
jgi:carbamoyltransferase